MKNRARAWLIPFLIAIPSSTLSAQEEVPRTLTSASHLYGDWSGALRLEIPFRVIVHWSAGLPGSAGKIDFPDQNANALPLTALRAFKDSVHFQLAAASIRFDGLFDSKGDTIYGTFAQGAQRFQLTLRRSMGTSASPPARPQEPTPPLPYMSEDVAFSVPTAGITLAGTLTSPSGGAHPAVLLLPGSGPLDRDAVVAGHRTSLVLADQLTRNGFAVLRFDKRGTSRSTGTFADAAVSDFAADAEAALAYLRSRPEVDSTRTLVLGHSEGALLATTLLARIPGLAGGILLAAPAQRGDALMLSRARALLAARGVPDSTLAKDESLRLAVFRAIERSGGQTQTAVRASIRKEVTEALQRMTSTERAMVGYSESEWASGAEVFLGQLAWFREFLSLDPVMLYERVDTPVLALFGTLDQQVPSEPNAERVRRALAAHGRAVEVDVLPGVNHQMQEARTGSPAEYGQISETVANAVLTRIIAWARATVYDK